MTSEAEPEVVLDPTDTQVTEPFPAGDGPQDNEATE